MTEEFAQAVIDGLLEKRDSLATGVVSGQLAPEEYKFHCGEIHGLDLAVDHIKAVLQKIEDTENE